MEDTQEVGVDIITPKGVPLSAKYRRSFAHKTVKDRLPVILTKVIDHLYRDKDEITNLHGEKSKEEVKDVIGFLSKLKNEMMTNKPLLPLHSDGKDSEIWNEYLLELKNQSGGAEPAWFDAPWLYVETYMYRRIREGFELSPSLESFDPFHKQKANGLISSMGAAVAVGNHLNTLLQRAGDMEESDVKNELFRIIKINLWGNKCDLSISCGTDNFQTVDPLKQLNQLEEFILVNDSEEVWKALTVAKNNKETVVDIILDNAGFELYTDFCLADFLCSFGLADKIRFYVKEIPWYISDTTVRDIHWTINTLLNKNHGGDTTDSSEAVVHLARRWHEYISSGKWKVEEELFWTLPHDFSCMKSVDDKLYNKLSESALIIFKGDLNYRKLVGDINWITTDSFVECLRGFHPSKLVSLRTVKADVIVGLKQGEAEAIEQKCSDWMITGDYAVIQFSNK